MKARLRPPMWRTLGRQTILLKELGRKINWARRQGEDLCEVRGGKIMGTMNGSAARRATAAPPPQWEPPLELHARSWTEEHARSVFHARKWRAQGGLARQSAYAAIDMLLVCGNALLIYGLRFGFSNSWDAVVAPRQVIGHISVQAYPGFLILYCSLIFLGCISQGLYRTPRELSTLAESIRVSKAVGIATALLVLFIFTSGNKEISRIVVVLAGVANVFTLSGWRYAKRRLGDLKEFRRVALAQFVDEVFVTLPSDGQMIKQLFLEARDLRLDLHVLPDLYDGLAWRAPLHMIGGFPIMELHREPIPTTGLAIKRAIDFMASLLGLILVAPLL